MPDILPKEILWRTKEAFSDGVSSLQKSWFEIINEKILFLYNTKLLSNKLDKYLTNENMTLEKHIINIYLKDIQDRKIIHYGCRSLLAKDASARNYQYIKIKKIFDKL